MVSEYENYISHSETQAGSTIYSGWASAKINWPQNLEDEFCPAHYLPCPSAHLEFQRVYVLPFRALRPKPKKSKLGGWISCSCSDHTYGLKLTNVWSII